LPISVSDGEVARRSKSPLAGATLSKLAGYHLAVIGVMA
jgi:hypothetical protein